MQDWNDNPYFWLAAASPTIFLLFLWIIFGRKNTTVRVVLLLLAISWAGVVFYAVKQTPSYIESLLEPYKKGVKVHKLTDSYINKGPWPAIGRVVIGTVFSSSHCTGTLVAPDRVLTTAHCFLDKDTGKLTEPEDVKFTPSLYQIEKRSGTTASTYHYGNRFDTSFNANPLQNDDDWAIIKLSEPIDDIKPIPLTTLQSHFDLSQIMGIGTTDNSQNRLRVQSGCRIVNTDNILRYFLPFQNNDNSYILHNCPSREGESGGPVIVKTDMGYEVLGVNVARTEQYDVTLGVALDVRLMK